MTRRFMVVLAGALAVLGLGSVTALAAGRHATAASSAPVLPTSDPFYTYSGSLADIAPGTILRRRRIAVAEGGNPTAITATQLLYRTTGELGEPTVTVATVIKPATQPLSTKIVSYQMAYDALGSECDPSYTFQGGNPSYSTSQEEEQLILGYVASGDTLVVPDYEGERLDWSAGQESGYNTIDGIRAAENLLGVKPNTTPVGMVGYSGGSIATDFAAELAPSYAPQLDIVGTAEGGVPADFFHNLSYINGSPSWSGVIPAVLVALGRAFGVSFNQYLSPYGAQVTNQVQGECINNFLGAYPGLTYQKLLKPQYSDIFKIAAMVRITDHLIMSRTGTPKGPLFMGVGDADGTGDGVMVTKDDEGLAHTYCQRGVSVEFNIYNGDDHDSAAVPFEVGALSFLTDRLNGMAVKNGCSAIGVGNSLAPLAVPVSPQPKLRFSYLGPRKRLHGVEIELFTTTGTLKHLVLTLHHGRKLITKIAVTRVTKSKHRVLLRDKGRMPGAGRYALKVTQGRATLLRRTLKVR